MTENDSHKNPDKKLKLTRTLLHQVYSDALKYYFMAGIELNGKAEKRGRGASV